MDTLLTPLLWFALVVAVIPVALWLLKRSPMGGALQGQGMRVVGMLPLSGTQRIVTIEVGRGEDRRWLVLGVTPASITTLHSLPPQGENGTSGSPQPAPAFADFLGRLKGSRGGGDAR